LYYNLHQFVKPWRNHVAFAANDSISHRKAGAAVNEYANE